MMSKPKPTHSIKTTTEVGEIRKRLFLAETMAMNGATLTRMYQQLEGKGVGTNKVEGIARGMVDDDLNKRGFNGSNSKFKLPEGWGFADGGKGATSNQVKVILLRTRAALTIYLNVMTYWHLGKTFLKLGTKLKLGLMLLIQL